MLLGNNRSLEADKAAAKLDQRQDQDLSDLEELTVGWFEATKNEKFMPETTLDEINPTDAHFSGSSTTARAYLCFRAIRPPTYKFHMDGEEDSEGSHLIQLLAKHGLISLRNSTQLKTMLWGSKAKIPMTLESPVPNQNEISKITQTPEKQAEPSSLRSSEASPAGVDSRTQGADASQHLQALFTWMDDVPCCLESANVSCAALMGNFSDFWMCLCIAPWSAMYASHSRNHSPPYLIPLLQHVVSRIDFGRSDPVTDSVTPIISGMESMDVNDAVLFSLDPNSPTSNLPKQAQYLNKRALPESSSEPIVDPIKVEENDWPSRTPTETAQAELLVSLFRAFSTVIQCGPYPWFNTVADQKQYSFGNSPNSGTTPSPTATFKACLDGFIYESPLALPERIFAGLEVKDEPRPAFHLLHASQDPVRRQEAAEIVAIIYTNRETFKEQAGSDETDQAQLFFSVNKDSFSFSVAIIPFRWLQYISDPKSLVLGASGASVKAADMLRIHEYGPARLDRSEDVRKILLERKLVMIMNHAIYPEASMRKSEKESRNRVQGI
ncbi:hypothetical protein VTL71DRAFT_9545 [Oculimacula yallundae]|uniref:Uncharacterized protein n=1 Tax=Oculimacula yallundae TaxID=86028 RepID=A0ABR4BTY6_9HELO